MPRLIEVAPLLLVLPLLYDVTSFSLTTPALSVPCTRELWRRGGRHRQHHSSSPRCERTVLSMSVTEERTKSRFLPKHLAQLYADYATRLWNETNLDARKKIANDRVSAAIRQMQGIKITDISPEALHQLDMACESLHSAIANISVDDTTTITQGLQGKEIESADQDTTTALVETNEKSMDTSKSKKRNGGRSVTFGALMGLAVACWVFSGNYIFTGLFTLMTILGQLEYYRMVINTGVYPARRISVVGACSMFLTALFTPELHQICLPIFGLWSMLWFLTMKRTMTTIPEIATTFTGMFYLGYVPSFWVRIRLLGGAIEPTRLAPIVGPMLKFVSREAKSKLPAWLPNAIHLPITTGAIFIFWSWLSLAFSDVGAYFVGKNFGKTKLGKISPAAGATSPNKTVEGVIGGCALSGILSIIGAWVQRWPYFVWSGAAHGIMLGLLGLLGDLTASMLKRDAGLKDFGDLLPEHGGILDRVDSFVWTAPYSWLVCAYLIPALKQVAR